METIESFAGRVAAWTGGAIPLVFIVSPQWGDDGALPNHAGGIVARRGDTALFTLGYPVHQDEVTGTETFGEGCLIGPLADIVAIRAVLGV